MASLYPKVRKKEKRESKDELTVELDDETPTNMGLNNAENAHS